MRVEELSGATAAVYRAVAELESDAGAPHLQDIARRTGLSLEETRAAVHRLLHTEPKILHEVPDTSPTDLGPVYELAPRT
jgi:predicted nuclease of restriction endonuclease-like RecB superfamily